MDRKLGNNDTGQSQQDVLNAITTALGGDPNRQSGSGQTTSNYSPGGLEPESGDPMQAWKERGGAGQYSTKDSYVWGSRPELEDQIAIQLGWDQATPRDTFLNEWWRQQSFAREKEHMNPDFQRGNALDKNRVMRLLTAAFPDG